MSAGTDGRRTVQRPLAATAGSGRRSTATMQIATTTLHATKGRTSGSAAYCASTPPTRAPSPLPPAWASVATIAARARSPSGSSSTRAADAVPLIAPTATPWTARAAKSHAVPCAAANSVIAMIETPSPIAITRRRPARSDSCPKVRSDGARTTA
jgi:hypothetical protein